MTRNTIISAALASFSLLASACGQKTERTATDAPVAASSAAPSGDSLTITRGGARPVQPGPADWFTGTVRIEPLFAATDASRAAASSVSFEPGARTAWHRHPRGQVLIVTDGDGRVQRRGGPGRGGSGGRCGVDPARRRALARRVAHRRDDPYRHLRARERERGHVARARERRGVRRSAAPADTADAMRKRRPTHSQRSARWTSGVQSRCC